MKFHFSCPVKLTHFFPVFMAIYFFLWTLDGVHPFYLELKPTGNAHGVFLKNSNGMDVVLGKNSLQYKITGGKIENSIILAYNVRVYTCNCPCRYSRLLLFSRTSTRGSH